MAVKPLCSPTQGSATRIPPKGIHQGRGPVSCLKKIRIKDAFILTKNKTKQIQLLGFHHKPFVIRDQQINVRSLSSNISMKVQFFFRFLLEGPFKV